MKKSKSLVAGLLITTLMSLQAPVCFAQSYTPYNNYQRQQLQGQVSIIPMGTTLSGVTTSELSSATMVVGDSVVLALNSPFYYKGSMIAPVNSNVIGIVTEAEKAGFASNTGKLKIKFKEIITPDGHRIPISAKVVTNDGKGVLMGQATQDKAKDVGKNLAIGSASGALAGLVFGSAAGGKAGKGAAIGTGIGAGLGFGKTLIDKGDNVCVPAGSQINIMIDQPVTVNY